jgi:hypothetical protein
MKRFIQVSVFIVIALALVIGILSFAGSGMGIVAEKAGIDTGLNSVSFFHSAASPEISFLDPGGKLPPGLTPNPNDPRLPHPNVGWNS